tara:strand:+ start:861 stop:1310 length:450 start_codon:yes stop_codon:yes gene_type:complete
MSLILNTLYIVTVTILLKIFFLKIMKVNRNYWLYLTILLYLFSSFIIFYYKDLNYSLIIIIITNGIFLVSFLLFLTIVYNESPSVYFLQNINKRKLKSIFLKKKFVQKRMQLLVRSKMINLKKMKLTAKGKILKKSILILSNILIYDHT